MCVSLQRADVMTHLQDDREIRVRGGSNREIQLSSDFVERVGDLLTPALVSVDGRLQMSYRSMLQMYPSEDVPNWRQVPTADYYPPFCGLLEPLSYLAEFAGAQITLPWIQCSTLERPQTTNVVNRSVTKMIHEHPWGIIELGPGVSQGEVIVDVCRGFPDARVLVLGPHIDPLARLCRTIRQSAPDISSIDASRGELTAECPDPDADEDEIVRAQLVFTTYVNTGGLHETEGTPYSCFDIALCLQPELIQGHNNTLFLSGADIRFRQYSLLSVDRPATPVRHQLMNVFGFRRVRIPAPGYARSAVSWVSIRNRTRLRNVNTANPPHQNLRQLQSDDKRNQRIASLARNIAATRNTPIDGIVGAWVSRNANPNEPLTVLTAASDSTQAEKLAGMLPGWPVFDASVTNNAEALRNLPLTSGGLIQRIICTREALEQLPVECNPNFIINATGGCHALQLPTCWMRHPLGTPEHNCRRLIVDLDDSGTPLTQRWSQLRFRDYERNDVFRFDHAVSNADQFSFAALGRFIQETFRKATT